MNHLVRSGGVAATRERVRVLARALVLACGVAALPGALVVVGAVRVKSPGVIDDQVLSRGRPVLFGGGLTNVLTWIDRHGEFIVGAVVVVFLWQALKLARMNNLANVPRRGTGKWLLLPGVNVFVAARVFARLLGADPRARARERFPWGLVWFFAIFGASAVMHVGHWDEARTFWVDNRWAEVTTYGLDVVAALMTAVVVVLSANSIRRASDRTTWSKCPNDAALLTPDRGSD